MSTSLDLSKTYTSYSGVDIRVVINGVQVGSMQALSYAIQREKAPIYVMGSVDPISYSRGKRGIAGTIISLLLDTHLLSSEVFKNEQYLGRKNEMFPGYTGDATTPGADLAALNSISRTNAAGDIDLKFVGGGDPSALGQPQTNTNGGIRIPNQNTQFNVENIASNYQVTNVFYVDQILPFDVAIIAANEYGQSAQMRLYGCEILNEGSGFSIDDIVVENQMTYVCRTILPWRSFNLNPNGQSDGSLRDQLYKNRQGQSNRQPTY
jgi:hypothetical protein